jgi:hypothetical protein
MDTSDKSAEYEALQLRAQELRKELSMDQPIDKLGLLRAEVQGMEALNEMRLRLQHLEEKKKLRAAARRIW